MVTPRHILKSLAFIAFTDGEMPVVYLGWSLEYEMYFYLAVALLMALTRDVWRNIVMIFSALAISDESRCRRDAWELCVLRRSNDP